jgi:hypothetical protein
MAGALLALIFVRHLPEHGHSRIEGAENEAHYKAYIEAGSRNERAAVALPPTTRSKSMSRFDAALTRIKCPPGGVLDVVLHTDGGTPVFNGYTHEQFVDLFHVIGSDSDNRVVILTGSGEAFEAFMESISPDGFDFFSP